MNFPEDLRYTREHEWVRVDGTIARIGITDYAQDALGDVVYVDLPTVGATVAAMASCCEVESTKSVSEIFSPVSGTIAEVNSDLTDAPQMINEDPYGKGWIFSVDMGDAGEVEGLMDAAAYQAFLDNEGH
ncbi:MAG TPA: glycine cleavage system protein GcvH [Acidimicrobiia bacterium]|nr:glycine cleavage system protein GcvH [Acidimicrobiia bacterium]HEU5449594.1 glycine cleavage system protein GcvH [Acidimicrobiia bacterium]